MAFGKASRADFLPPSSFETRLSGAPHVWTVPVAQEVNEGTASVGSGHVSGLFARSVTAGPKGFRRTVSNQDDALEAH